MTERRRQDLRGTYLRLGLGELVSACLFGVIALLRLADSSSATRVAIWGGLAPLLVVLVQAAIYWLLARSWVGSRTMPAGLAGVYGWLRVVNVALLVVGLAVLLLAEASVTATVAGIAIWLFALVEHVNYYVVRLAYPLTAWWRRVREWRRPRLVLDVAAGRAA